MENARKRCNVELVTSNVELVTSNVVLVTCSKEQLLKLSARPMHIHQYQDFSEDLSAVGFYTLYSENADIVL